MCRTPSSLRHRHDRHLRAALDATSGDREGGGSRRVLRSSSSPSRPRRAHHRLVARLDRLGRPPVLHRLSGARRALLVHRHRSPWPWPWTADARHVHVRGRRRRPRGRRSPARRRPGGARRLLDGWSDRVDDHPAAPGLRRRSRRSSDSAGMVGESTRSLAMAFPARTRLTVAVPLVPGLPAGRTPTIDPGHPRARPLPGVARIRDPARPYADDHRGRLGAQPLRRPNRGHRASACRRRA